MKESDGWVKIKKYTDDDGKPVCGDVCKMLEVRPKRFGACTHSTTDHTPGPTCPVWYCESKSDNEVVERMQAMCEESLDPERFGAWDDIKNQLFSNRSSLTPQEK